MTAAIGLHGATGRMGRAIVAALAADDDAALAGAFVRASNPLLGQDAGVVAGVAAQNVALAEIGGLARLDALIDFSLPDGALLALERCVAGGCPFVSGTTGFDAAGLDAISQATRSIPVLLAPNMSVGVNLTFHLIRQAAAALGDDVDIEVVEAHHRHKVDAPSGTAVRIGEILAEQTGRDLDAVAVHGRQGHTGARARDAIGFSALRGGDIVGEHTVYFAGEGERIEITHRASSRSNFALGAVRAAKWIAGRAPGSYGMDDVLGL
ncbi:MAG: 4-hydroxy-tetrahydrodipicolinate reductase [Pseudomonadota bacterium]